MSQSISLHYFDGMGRAEVIRLALAYGKVDFEDVRMTFPEFGAAKAAGKYPFGQVPALVVNGEVIGQSGAILLFASKKSDLYPSDDLEALRVDEMLDFLKELETDFPRPSVSGEDEQAAAVTKWENNTVLPRIEILKKRLAASKSGYLVNEKLSAADFQLLTFVKGVKSGFVSFLPKDILTKHACIQQHYELIQKIPSVVEYYKTHKDVE